MISAIILIAIGYIAGVITMCVCQVADGNKDDEEYDIRRDYYEKGYEDGQRATRAHEDDLK